LHLEVIAPGGIADPDGPAGRGSVKQVAGNTQCRRPTGRVRGANGTRIAKQQTLDGFDKRPVAGGVEIIARHAPAKPLVGNPHAFQQRRLSAFVFVRAGRREDFLRPPVGKKLLEQLKLRHRRQWS
jgi:hypothetical protein